MAGKKIEGPELLWIGLGVPFDTEVLRGVTTDNMVSPEVGNFVTLREMRDTT